MTNIDRVELQAMAQILHNLWFEPPGEELLAMVAEIPFVEQWPLGDSSPEAMQACELMDAASTTVIQASANLSDEQAIEALQLDYTRLFVGPGVPLCPPWGSMYLCETGLLNDVSTQALVAFYKDSGLELDSTRNEPVDHLGLMLAVIANALATEEGTIPVLMDSDEHVAFSRAWLALLLREYLMPFAPQCIALLAANAKTDFYRALAPLTLNYLQSLQSQLEAELVSHKSDAMH
ncbi:molecular chaperone [Shewanella sp. NIFS-20-20]|uniref:TorD/DmsD family molecular chaperone n=1 Tax=Shewanella sp. NIFS-20-20 TaxID=2853806 RepID=UPI001C488399|nr:molecular chaperone TorD family protein [Shewanella sp. NIFS-20-20]MBV7316302.1 molecular chaperone TorD family protein [Shewanella sp. NIFS-20-20]